MDYKFKNKNSGFVLHIETEKILFEKTLKKITKLLYDEYNNIDKCFGTEEEKFISFYCENI